MIRNILLLTCLGLFGCVVTSEQMIAATEDESDAYINCVLNNAALMSHTKERPDIIAVAATSQCESEKHALYLALRRVTRDPERANQMINDVEISTRRQVVGFVTKLRTEQDDT